MIRENSRYLENQGTDAEVFMPKHDKTNKTTCAPSEESGMPGYHPSMISLRCKHEEPLGP